MLNIPGHLRTKKKFEYVTFAATSSHFWNIYFTLLNKAITDAGVEVNHKTLVILCVKFGSFNQKIFNYIPVTSSKSGYYHLSKKLMCKGRIHTFL